MRNSVRMLVFLMVLSSICTILLSSANYAFEKASDVFNRRLYQVILEKFEIPARERQIEQKFTENFEIKQIGHTIYYISKNKQKGAVIFKAEGPGLWSTLEVLIAVYPDFEQMLWLKVLAQAETPGLGGRIAEEEFQARFDDTEIRPELRIVKFASAPNEVDAVTGASMTSAALGKIINQAIKDLDQAFGKEKS